MAHPTTVAHLFLREPRQWGRRGDPYLWRAMRDRLEDVPLPADFTTVTRLLEEALAAEAGVHPGETEGPKFVERFAHGGMSSGVVDVTWWRKTAIPILIDRWAAATGN
jgi:hypothetical protein